MQISSAPLAISGRYASGAGGAGLYSPVFLMVSKKGSSPVLDQTVASLLSSMSPICSFIKLDILMSFNSMRTQFIM